MATGSGFDRLSARPLRPAAAQIALFNPGMRHELEERRSKAMRREEEGNARDGDAGAREVVGAPERERLARALTE